MHAVGYTVQFRSKMFSRFVSHWGDLPRREDNEPDSKTFIALAINLYLSWPDKDEPSFAIFRKN